MTSIASTLTAPRAGLVDDMTEEDNNRGPERDETDRFHQIVKQLVDDGDDRAATAGRQTRRTFQEMAPGQTRQPVLHLTRPLTFTPTAPTAPAGPVAGGQCTSCRGAGGRMIDTSSDGVTRQNWQTCQPCGGTGVAR